MRYALKIRVDAIDAIEPLAAEKGIELRAAIDPSLPAASLDDRRILQVLANLFGNAIKFSKQGSEVHVALTGTEDMLEVSIRDFAGGVPAEFVNTIFERFQRGIRRDQLGVAFHCRSQSDSASPPLNESG